MTPRDGGNTVRVIAARALWVVLAAAVGAGLLLLSVAISIAITCFGSAEPAGVIEGLVSLFVPTATTACLPAPSAVGIAFLLLLLAAALTLMSLLIARRRRLSSSHEGAPAPRL